MARDPPQTFAQARPQKRKNYCSGTVKLGMSKKGLRKHPRAKEGENHVSLHVTRNLQTQPADFESKLILRQACRRINLAFIIFACNTNVLHCRRSIINYAMLCLLLLLAACFVPLVTGSIDNPDVFVSATFVWVGPADKAVLCNSNHGIPAGESQFTVTGA